MFVTDVVLALLLALALGCLVIVLGGMGGPGTAGWPAAVVLFCVIFLMTWAGGIWLSPLGPRIWGTSWIPFLFVGIVSALLLGALSPRPRASLGADARVETREVVLTTANVFFWVLIAVLISAVVLHYADIVERRELMSTYGLREAGKLRQEMNSSFAKAAAPEISRTSVRV